MVSTFSPQSEVGSTLHFISPTRIHDVDPASAFKELRRSLSRSPSKGPAFRLVTSKSTSPSPSSPLSPRQPTPNRSASTGLLPRADVVSPSPLGAPHTASAKKSLSSLRRASPMRMPSRSRGLQRSPSRIVLGDSCSQGNATPRSSSQSSDDVENRRDCSASPAGEFRFEGFGKCSGLETQNGNLAPHGGLARFEKGRGSFGTFPAKSSPLKRSDGIMNLDSANLGSPSAKRRSLHGATFTPDFDIFAYESARQNNFDSQMTDDIPSLDNGSFDSSPALSPLPKRSSSLRKSTLQQRYEKPTFAKSKPNTDLAFDFATPGQGPSMTRSRLSLDNHLPSMAHESPFSSQAALLNASVHPVSQVGTKVTGTGNPQHPQRHPLSRTITQSSSNSSMAEDSPTHIPIRQPEHRRQQVDFSKSLPIGTIRPTSSEAAPSSQFSSNEGSFATPENYKLAKPLPAAFMSTGLISKRHANLEDGQGDFRSSKASMPDTPCKRHSLMGAPAAIIPNSAFKEPRPVRHSFGTASTPVSVHTKEPSPGAFGKGVSIFGSTYNRRGSFLSVDGDDTSLSPLAKGDSQSSTDFEMPPTPTKQALTSELGQSLNGGHSTRQGGNKQINGGMEPSLPCSPQNQQSCKFIPIGTPTGSADEDSESVMDESPSTALRFRSISSVVSSFSRSRSSRNLRSPTPHRKPFSTPKYLRPRVWKAKPSPLSPASPIPESFSPHTPRESMMPPDPSGLSISAYSNGLRLRSPNSSTSRYAPATPTSTRDDFSRFGKSSTMTPSHNPVTTEIDPIITARFDKAELIGTGEFSQVYRVSQAQEVKTSRSYFSLPASRASPKTPLPDRVWAVKKSRNPYLGARDRQRKLQEVNALKALGHSDHTLHLIDSWEETEHLYIQTEYCEEGTLSLFLEQAGRNARLDDFRIWKILLELSLGVKHIHDSGFMHLDLKPANVLITFEGVLKISDFGMATQWPAQPGIDGEGDREYIGPEILMGHPDKPSDVFALGLIMVEIAGNVMLPDNGVSWQRLRTGDLSDVPSLTWSSDTSTLARDSSGKPLSQAETSIEDFYGSDSGGDDLGSPKYLRQNRQPTKQLQFPVYRPGELAEPPTFMTDAHNQGALDNIVRWMISPKPMHRPIVDQVLATKGVQWVELRRRGGATIYEGNWGPADEILADDAEMIDV